MKKSRRIRIDKIIKKIDELMAAVEELRLEEDEAYNNLPDSLQSSERGDAMYNAIDNLECAGNCLEEVEDYLNEAKGE